LLRYRDGTFQNVLPGLKQAEVAVTAMCRGRNGDILFSGAANGLVRYSGGKFVTLAPNNKLILSMAETDDGKVWMGSRESGLFYLRDCRKIKFTILTPCEILRA
jgi:hypothetical protein